MMLDKGLVSNKAFFLKIPTRVHAYDIQKKI